MVMGTLQLTIFYVQVLIKITAYERKVKIQLERKIIFINNKLGTYMLMANLFVTVEYKLFVTNEPFKAKVFKHLTKEQYCQQNFIS